MENNGLWIWGYVLKKVPDEMMFSYRKDNYCSLETAANYLGADNVVFMDSCTDRHNLNAEMFQPLAGVKQVVCGLEHGHYAETARMVSEFSLQHPQITGALIDDFRDPPGPSGQMTVAELKEVYEQLKSCNPSLKLYLVRYHMRQNYEELVAFKDYFDGLMLWCWTSTEHFWKALYKYDLLNCRSLLPGKIILQGQFIHDFYEYPLEKPASVEQLALQCDKIGRFYREGFTDGWIVLQNAFFSHSDHREQVQFLKNYFDWYFGTWTRR